MNREGRGKPVHAIKLGRLLQAVPAARLRDGSAATEIAGLACDSRAVQPGFLFCALPGEKTTGGLFVEEAARRGAVAVVHENGMRLPRELADVAVDSARRAMAERARGDACPHIRAHGERTAALLGGGSNMDAVMPPLRRASA